MHRLQNLTEEVARFLITGPGPPLPLWVGHGTLPLSPLASSHALHLYDPALLTPSKRRGRPPHLIAPHLDRRMSIRTEEASGTHEPPLRCLRAAGLEPQPSRRFAFAAPSKVAPTTACRTTHIFLDLRSFPPAGGGGTQHTP